MQTFLKIVLSSKLDYKASAAYIMIASLCPTYGPLPRRFCITSTSALSGEPPHRRTRGSVVVRSSTKHDHEGRGIITLQPAPQPSPEPLGLDRGTTRRPCNDGTVLDFCW